MLLIICEKLNVAKSIASALDTSSDWEIFDPIAS